MRSAPVANRQPWWTLSSRTLPYHAVALPTLHSYNVPVLLVFIQKKQQLYNAVRWASFFLFSGTLFGLEWRLGWNLELGLGLKSHCLRQRPCVPAIYSYTGLAFTFRGAMVKLSFCVRVSVKVTDRMPMFAIALPAETTRVLYTVVDQYISVRLPYVMSLN